MNAVQNVTTDLSNIVPTGRTTAKTASQRFDAVRERVFSAQGTQCAPSPQKEQSAETAAEQGMVVPAAPPQVAATPVEAETTAQSHDVLQGVNALQQQLSKCCDLPEPVGGIADILEGFGLLNRSEDVIELTTEGQAFLAQLFQELMGAEQQAAGSAPYAAGNEAGMLNTAIPEETQQALQLLIKEYLCSLENANSPGTVPVSVSAEHQETLPLPLAGAAGAGLKDSVENLPVQPTEDANVTVSTAASSEQSRVIQTTPLERLVQALTQRNDDAAPQESTLQEQKSPVAGHEPMQAGAIHSPLSLQRSVLTSANPGAANVAPTQADMAQNISNIVEEMSFRAGQEIQEFSVSLKPAHLGELSITLTKSSDGLLAQIKAADASTKGLIQNEVAALTAQLKDKGIEIRQIEVVYEAPAFTTDMRQNEGRRDTASSAPHKSRLYRIGAAQESYGAAIDSTAITASPLLMDSSVEYQA